MSAIGDETRGGDIEFPQDGQQVRKVVRKAVVEGEDHPAADGARSIRFDAPERRAERRERIPRCTKQINHRMQLFGLNRVVRWAVRQVHPITDGVEHADTDTVTRQTGPPPGTVWGDERQNPFSIDFHVISLHFLQADA